MIGTTLGDKYKLLRPLGEGAMGSVYEAVPADAPDRRVAVKVINRRLLDPNTDGAHRFRREARAASAIDSDHIVQILDSGTDEPTGLLFIVMECLEGTDLQRLLERAGPLAPERALRVAAQALLGLEKAHGARIVHRDIKPANIFLARRGDGTLTVKLLDFGIAKIKSDPLNPGAQTTGLTTSGGFLGSPLYMSPEQVQNSRDVDHRTDIWSLGTALYCALAGRAPYQHIESIGQLIVTICAMPPPPISDFAPWVSPEIARILEEALQLSPSARYPSAGAMLAALRPLLPDGTELREEMLEPVSTRTRAAFASTVTADAPPSAAPRRENDRNATQPMGIDVPPEPPAAVDAGATRPLESALSETVATDSSSFRPFRPPREEDTASEPIPRPLPALSAPSAPSAPPAPQDASTAPPPPPSPPIARTDARRRRGLVVLALTALTAALIALRGSSPLPSIAPFAEGERGIVLGGRWLASDEGRALCHELADFNDRQVVRCLDVAVEGRAEAELRESAKRAGARLVAVVNSDGTARLSPLGESEGTAPLGRDIPVDLGRRADWARLKVVVNAISWIVAPRPDGAPEHLACPPLPEGGVDPLGLLALLVVPSCGLEPVDPQRLLAVCRAKSESEDCALARYLYADTCPSCPDTQQILEELRDRGPLCFRPQATLKLARAACKVGLFEEATRAVLSLSTEGGLCLRTTLPEIAACILASAPAPADPRLVALEALPVADEAWCPPAVRAATLGRRAYFRGRAQRWAEAATDYADAYRLSHESTIALSLAEALIHEGKPSAATERLGGLTPTALEGSSRVYAALLRWIAARDGGALGAREEAEALVQDYRSLPSGKIALPGGPDPELRQLACPAPSAPAPAAADCAYDVLSHAKTESSVERLAASLGRGGAAAQEQGSKR